MDGIILEILEDVTGVSPSEIEPEIDLFDEGILDSFGMIHMFVKISDICGVELDIGDTPRDEINTVEKIIALVNGKSGQK